MSFNCPDCKRLAAPADRFCGQCGARLTQEAPSALAAEVERPESQPVHRGEILWSVPLPGDIADVIPDEEGRLALAGPSKTGSVFAVAFESVDENVEDPLAEFEDGVIEDVGVESGVLSALDPAAGEKIWSVGFGKEAFEAGPLSPELLAVSLHSRGSIMALNRLSGRPRWNHQMQHSGEWIPKVVCGGRVYAADGRTLLALEAGTGENSWDAVLESPARAIVAGGPAILAAAGIGGLAAFDPRQGALLWRHDLSVARLWVATDRLAIVATGGSGRGEDGDMVLALDLATGKELWRLPCEAEVLHLTCDDGRLYLQGMDGRLSAVDAEEGSEVWHLEEVPPEGVSCWADGGLFLAFSGEGLVALDPHDARLLWDSPGGDYEVPSVSIDARAGAIYIGTDEGRVALLDPSTGTIRWEVALPSRTVENFYIDAAGNEERVMERMNADVSQVIPDGRGRLFVVADGTLYAIG